MKTEPWWVCDVCNTPVQKVGSRKKGSLKDNHGCERATYMMKQVLQKKS